jgi:hypothetical protein
MMALLKLEQHIVISSMKLRRFPLLIRWKAAEHKPITITESKIKCPGDAQKASSERRFGTLPWLVQNVCNSYTYARVQFFDFHRVIAPTK